MEQMRNTVNNHMSQVKDELIPAELTTLCYIEQDGRYLMLHRVKKEKDINKDKWIGLGGHFEGTESPEECVLREVKEETGLTLTSLRFRGLITFVSGDTCLEYMSLFTADRFEGEVVECDEGTLEWVPKEDVYDLELWAGDKLFLRLLEEDRPFFSLKLVYDAEGRLQEAVLDGKRLELLDILEEDGTPTGEVQERDTAHRLGLRHATVHMWVLREEEDGNVEVLLQKRSQTKDSNPGCWDISSAGHISAGDEKLPAAVRELSEELGIHAEPEDLTYLGFTRRNVMKPFYGKQWYDNQISYIYVYRKEVDIDTIRLQEEEVEEVRWMKLDEVAARMEGDVSFKHCLNPEEIGLLQRSL